MFNSAFQFFQERCQHHIHKKIGGKRVVPNACRSKTRPKECKHEAPWTNRVSPGWMTKPLVLCKALAKSFQLRCSGARNWLGQILCVRNDEWVNGTMPGLCVALAGSNSDVKPNDRLPIIPETHEKCCRKKRCLVRKHTLKHTTRITQRAQSVCNGYFWRIHWQAAARRLIGDEEMRRQAVHSPGEDAWAGKSIASSRSKW